MLFFSNLPRNEMVRKNKENWETFSPSSFDPNVFIIPIRFITHSLKCVMERRTAYVITVSPVPGKYASLRWQSPALAECVQTKIITTIENPVVSAN